MGSVAFFLAAWLLLDAGSRRNDILASACLVGSLACSGLGLAVLVGCTVRLAMRRTSWRRWWVVTVPAVLYVAWYLGYGVSQASSSNLSEVPSYIWSSLGGGFGAVAGRGLGAGQIAGTAVALFVIWRAYRAPRFRPEIVGAGCAVLFNWILTAISRGSTGDPAASRYVYVGVVFVIVVTAEAARGLRPPSIVQAGVVGAAILCVWGNWHLATAGSRGLRQASQVVRAELAAIEWAGDVVEPELYPDLVRMPTVTAGPYLDAVRSLGSPAFTEAEVASLPERDRQAVDDVSLDAVQFEVEADPRPSSGAAPTLLSGGGLRSGACIQLRPGIDPSPAVLTLGSRGVTVRAQGDQRLALSRFADLASSSSEVTTRGGVPFAIAVRGDDVARPWRLSIPLTVPVEVCSRP
jgi:hypothetical protein